MSVQKKQTSLPFHRRLIFHMLWPVFLVGALTSAFLVYYLSQPLAQRLTDQYDTDLNLSSALALKVCEEAFNSVLVMGREGDAEMNRTVKREALSELYQLSQQFPHLHIYIVEGQQRVYHGATDTQAERWQGEDLDAHLDQLTHLSGDQTGMRARIRKFYPWDWHIVSFINQQDYHALVREARIITYGGAAAVFIVVFITLMIVFTHFVYRPLLRLRRATEGGQAGRFEKIYPVPENELGRLTGSFNAMIDRIDAEKHEVEMLVQELSKSSRMLRLVVDTVPVRLFWKDRDSVYLGSNRSFSDDAGLDSPLVISGKTDHDLFPESALAFRADDAEVMESGNPKLLFEESQERRDGTTRWLMTNKVPMRDDKGSVLGVLGTYYDITDYKDAQAELRLLRKHLTSIVDSMPSLLVAVDTDLCVTLWNDTAAKVTGLSSEEVRGRDLCEVCSLFTYDREKIEQSLQEQTVIVDSDRFYQTDEETTYQTMTVYPLSGDGLKGAVIRLDDVTETFRLQAQLSHRSRMDAIGQLAGGVAHDFNNMLGGIIGTAELLQARLQISEEDAQLFDMLIEAADRAAGLTQKLLAFARKQQQASTLIDMHEVIRDAVALLRQSIDKRIEIEVDVQADEAMVVGDPSQLQNVIMNLGINASHAMPAGGTFKIATARQWLDATACRNISDELKEGNFLRIEVRDNGFGIEPQVLPRIFEPFYTTKKQGEGTGLGLAAAFGVMQQHGGGISVYSELGIGTVFYLYLPVSEGTKGLSAGRPELLSGSGKVLLVEDEHILRVSAQMQLETLGYAVAAVENGEEAVNYFRAHWQEVDLVLLDMIMPVMNGRDCYALLKDINPDVRVILCSGFSSHEDIVEVRNAGLSGFLQKPFSIAELSQQVAAVLD